MKFTPASTGVRPYSQTVQGTDSFISSKASIADGVVSINVHDANIAGLKHYIQMSMAQNKAFVEGVLNYHQGYHSVSTMLRSLKGFMNLNIDEESKEAILQDFANELFKTTKNRKDYSLDEIAEKVWITVAQAMNGDIRKAELFGNLKSVQQYAGEGGQYYLTDVDKTKAKEIKAQLESDKKKLLNQVEALFKSNITSPAPIEEQARVLQGNPVAQVKKADVLPNKPKLPFKNQYTAKDQEKSDKATKYIGFGVEGSSTENYRKSWGLFANSSQYSKDDKVFVSVNGNTKNRVTIQDGKFKKELDLAIDAGVTFISDNAEHRNRPYNIGERELVEYLISKGYQETDGNGVWVKGTLSETEVAKSFSIDDIEKSVNNRQVSSEQKDLFNGLIQVVKTKYPNLSLSFEELDKGVKGFYSNGKITLNKVLWDKLSQEKNYEQQVALINHELMHAVTLDAIVSYPKHKAVKDLQDMRDQLAKKWEAIKGQDSELDGYLTHVFEVEDASELVAYGTENPKVRDFIAKHLDVKALGLKATGGKYKGAFQAFTEAIFALIHKLLGKGKHIPYRVFMENIEAVMAIDVSEPSNRKANSKDLTTPKDKAIKILQGEAVASINQKDIAIPRGGFKSVIVWANDLFESWDNKALSTELGEVIFNEQSIRDSLGHGLSFHKVLAIPTLKNVIEQGAVIYHDTSKPKEDSFFISAPVLLDGKENIVTVTVHRDVNTQRMYVHSVSLTDKIKNTPLTVQVSAAPELTGKPHSLQNNQESDLPNAKHSGKYGKSGRVSKNHDGSVTPDEINILLQNLLNDNSQRRYSKESLKSEAEYTVNNIDISELLKGLDTGSMSDSFNTHLDALNDNLLKVFYGKTNKGLVNEKAGKLSYIKAHGFMQSQKEAYTHNAIYEVLDLFMTNQAGSIPASQMNKLYETVKQAYPSGKALFKDYDNVDTDTRKLYDKMYAYVFKPKDNVNTTARFMTMALTNEQFGKLLNRTKTKEIKETKTWFDKVMGVFSKIIGAISDKVYKANSKNDLKKIESYVNALAKLETKARNERADRLQLMWEKGINVTSKLNSPIVNNTKKAVKFVKDRNFPIVSSLAGSLYGFANSGNEAISNLAGMADIAKSNELGKAMNELVQEVTHHGNSGQLLDKLMRMTQHIGQVRQRVKDGNIKSLKNSFNEPLTKEQSYAITRVMVKTDLAGLLNNGFKPKEVYAMLNKTKRQIKIDKLLKELRPLIKSNEQFNDMVHQSLILGKYMATGVTSAHLVKNSEGIAKSYGSDWQTDTLDKDIHEIVDSLVSLYALGFVDASDLSIVEELVRVKRKV